MSRLIDADALDAEMYHKSFEVDDGRNVWNSGLWIRYKIFEEAIRDAPTIDAVPVVHGRWQDEGNLWLCTACGNGYVTEAGVTPIDAGMHYCPNCGARMEGEA